MEESVEEYTDTSEEKERNIVFIAKKQMYMDLLPRK